MNRYKVLNKLKKEESICLIGHLSPDADDLASMIAFKHFLQDKFKVKRVDIFSEYGRLSTSLKNILGSETINPKPLLQYNVAVMMDSPNTARLGEFEPLFKGAKVRFVIDHHATNNFSGEYNIVEYISSTCEIIYKIMKTFHYSPNKELLEKIYAGILTDTNGFGVGAISPDTFKIAGEISKQVDVVKLYSKHLTNRRVVDMQMLAVAVNNLEQFENGRILMSKITAAEMKKFNADDDDLFSIPNSLNSIETADVVCIYSNEKKGNHVSLRAKEGFNISNIAKDNGGGGHPGAAAFMTDLSYEKVKQLILPQLKKVIAAKDIMKD